MNARKILTPVILVVLAGIVFWGCAGSQMVARQPVEADLSSYTSVLISVESSVAEDVSEEMVELESQVVARINKMNMFEKVLLGEEADKTAGLLKIKATISGIRKVSGTQRFFLGVMAGQASMTIDISFVDAASGKELGAYTVTGKSGGTGLSGGTNEAIKKAAEAIVDILSAPASRPAVSSL